MAIFLDKTTPTTEWLRNDLPKTLVDVISSIKLALEKTPIYFQGSQRVKANRLIIEAKNKMPKYLGKHKVFCTILSEQKIKTHFNQISYNDRIDLLIEVTIGKTKWIVVVEFDAARADQVSKKFVSRIAQVPAESLIYIACCYSGIANMNLKEVEKFFSYMESISKNLSLAGFIGMSPPKNRGDVA